MGKSLKYGEFTFSSDPVGGSKGYARGGSCNMGKAAKMNAGGMAQSQNARRVAPGGVGVVRPPVANAGPRTPGSQTGAPEVNPGRPSTRPPVEQPATPGRTTPRGGPVNLGTTAGPGGGRPGIMPAMAKGGMTSKQQAKVGKVMGEFKAGELHSGSKSGPVVKSRKQAVAIGLSEARKAGKN